METKQKIPILKRLDILFIVLFFISFLNSILATVYCVLLLYYIKHGIEGEIKALILITFRGILNSAVASGIGNSIVKLGVIMILSLMIIVPSSRHNNDNSGIIIFFAVLFSVIVAFNSFIFSSYPITALFKVLSFILPFCAIMKGVGLTKDDCNWEDFLCLIMTLLMGISLFLLPFPQFRIVNSDFQGIFNHVNLAGSMCAIYLALVLKSKIFQKKKILFYIVILTTLLMVFETASRTGMITCVAVLMTYFLFKVQSTFSKVFTVFLGGVVISFLYISSINDFGNPVMHAIHEFMWKNSVDSIFDSRAEIISDSLKRFEVNRLTGTGFMVPYVEGLRNYSLNFNLIVEPGNLIYMLLGDTGIFGLVLFALVILLITIKGKKEDLFLIIVAILINMGEMVFFSSNNYSILIYLLLSIYMCTSRGEKEWS